MQPRYVSRARERTQATGRSKGRRIRPIVLIGLLVAAVLVSGCDFPHEQTLNGYSVFNSSSNRYFVQMTYADGSVTDMVVPPKAEADEYSESDPVRAEVYDSTCSLLATLPMSGRMSFLVIDETGTIMVGAGASYPSLPLATMGPTHGVCPFGAK